MPRTSFPDRSELPSPILGTAAVTAREELPNMSSGRYRSSLAASFVWLRFEALFGNSVRPSCSLRNKRGWVHRPETFT